MGVMGGAFTYNTYSTYNTYYYPTPLLHKKTAASRGAQPTSNQKTIFYKKSIFRYFFIFYDVERFCKILTPPPRHRSYRK